MSKKLIFIIGAIVLIELTGHGILTNVFKLFSQ